MDNREFRQIVDEFGAMVYRIALNQTRNVADAEDVVQTVFEKLYAKPPADLSPERVKPWLIRVTANECASLWRTLWKRRVTLGEVTDESLAAGARYGSGCGSEIASCGQAAETPADPVFADPAHERLYEALGNLPEKCRMVVHLFYFEDYPTAAIAEVLQIREPTVRTRLARARKLLKQQLKEEWDDE